MEILLSNSAVCGKNGLNEGGFYMAIPFIIGVAAAGGAIYGTGKYFSAKDKIECADRTNRAAQKTVKESKQRLERDRDVTNETLKKLGETKISIMATSGSRFIDTFKRIENIDDEYIVGLDRLRNFGHPKEVLSKMKDSSQKFSELAKAGLGSLAAGTATAAGVYGSVGLLGAASTGTAISALSGAAATNATLAWLGGGAIAAGGGGMVLGTAVLGALVAGPAIAVVGIFAESKADEALSTAKENEDKANAYKKETDSLCTAMKAIRKYASQIDNLLKRLDDKFRPAIDGMISITRTRGYNWRNYRRDEKQLIGIAMQLAETITIIVESSLLDKNENLNNDEVREVISIGQEMLESAN